LAGPQSLLGQVVDDVSAHAARLGAHLLKSRFAFVDVTDDFELPMSSHAGTPGNGAWKSAGRSPVGGLDT